MQRTEGELCAAVEAGRTRAAEGISGRVIFADFSSRTPGKIYRKNSDSPLKQRFCLAGMRWKQPGATGILNLRALVLTAQRWTQFWQKINLFGVPSVAAALN